MHGEQLPRATGCKQQAPFLGCERAIVRLPAATEPSTGCWRFGRCHRYRRSDRRLEPCRTEVMGAAEDEVVPQHVTPVVAS